MIKNDKYRTIPQGIWQDDSFLDLPIQEQLVYLNCRTSPQTLQIGVVTGGRRAQAMQCGCTVEELESILKALEKKGLIVMSQKTTEYYLPLYFIENMHQSGAPVLDYLNREADSVKDYDLLMACLSENYNVLNTSRNIVANKTMRDFLKAICEPCVESVKATPENNTVSTVSPAKHDDAVSENAVSQEEESSVTLAAGPSHEEERPSIVPQKNDADAPAPYDVDKIFSVGKYKDKNRSYLYIAEHDPAYAQYWADKTDAQNPSIPLTFQMALAMAKESEEEEPDFAPSFIEPEQQYSSFSLYDECNVDAFKGKNLSYEEAARQYPELAGYLALHPDEIGQSQADTLKQAYYEAMGCYPDAKDLPKNYWEINDVPF
jgi:hypothetical protein